MNLNEADAPSLVERLHRALGQVRAEYENDDELSSRFETPLYFGRLVGITPSFLVGGRGTGKTTTLRSMSFKAQARMAGNQNPDTWAVIGGYWKIEPNVVAVFRGKGVAPDLWSSTFAHYLNLKLSSLVLDYAVWLERNSIAISIDPHKISLFTRALNLESADSITGLSMMIDLSLADLESKINGRISALESTPLSIPGKPLDYLLAAVAGLGVSRTKPFMFCLDEYENLSDDQKTLLNTLIKQVGGGPYTFKIGVRNSVAIARSTLISDQPLQDPADFATIDIVTDLKGESFERFAERVIAQRLALIDLKFDPGRLLPSLSLEDEAELLGAGIVRDEAQVAIVSGGRASSAEVDYLQSLSDFEASFVLKWAEAHGEDPLAVLQFAMSEPKKWSVRFGNYGYACLFTIRSNRVGERKYFTGWKTYCQLADGNIRYLIRLVYEALLLHITDGKRVEVAISMSDQTRAAARVGETTIRDLQSWSRQGAALTRMALGLGSVFATLARESALSTPEVSQFRVNYANARVPHDVVDEIVNEAVGQGILIGFEGDKNARSSGFAREIDYQLHPVLSPYFVYSHRSKRRMVVNSDDLIGLTKRDFAASTVRKILGRRGVSENDAFGQPDLLAGL